MSYPRARNAAIIEMNGYNRLGCRSHCSEITCAVLLCLRERFEPTASVLIIDGHAVIDNNKPYTVPLEVFDALSQDGFVHLESPPDTIADRWRLDLVRLRPER
jgi:adenylate kinase